MNPLTVALQGKGYLNLAQRAVSIINQYGITAKKLDRALEQFSAVLDRFGCQATFPVTAVVLARNPQVIAKYQQRGNEFAIHGHRHINYSQLSLEDQVEHLNDARQIFNRAGIQACGFRGPYLQANGETLIALQNLGLAYDSSQGYYWDIQDNLQTPAYRHVLSFYNALPTSSYPCLPRLENNIVRLPYSLPDDEALVHRLALKSTEQMSAAWLAVLKRSYELGELFTLGLHPERTFACLEPMAAVLAQARQYQPAVWIARLDEIDRWWRERCQASLKITDASGGGFEVTVSGPDQLTVLARGVEIEAPNLLWYNGYQQVRSRHFIVHTSQRPCLGISPKAHPGLSGWARQQGYAVEVSNLARSCTCYLDQTDFKPEDQRRLLAQLETNDHSLIRLGYWPGGARSALAITGDIDALTLWDYGLRFCGR